MDSEKRSFSYVTWVMTAVILIAVGSVFFLSAPDEPSGDSDESSDLEVDDVADEAPDAHHISEGGSIFEVLFPYDGAVISSPMRVEGTTVGTWYSEGAFSVLIVDADGETIAEGVARAQGDWMTESFVAFEGELEFEGVESGAEGSVILKKANPSGLPENDDQLVIEVIFE